jgi:exodeoxyribonuclease VII large subunit
MNDDALRKARWMRVAGRAASAEVAERTPSPVIPVSRFVASARLLLERELGLLWIGGEVSGCTRAASGHYYFTLKDAGAQVRCVFFRHKAQGLPFALRDGLAVEVRAVASIYEPRGEFQLNVEAMRQAGVGALYERFLARKRALEAAGLFDAARKRPLPRFPRCIGIVTSPHAAALRDVLTTLRRRFPALPVILYPASVQGAGAAGEIAAAIRDANAHARVDVLIVCRGGGALEDLWAFNEEVVARAIFASRLPIVSGVGHETDFTICDFVADVRAPTPTAAATLAVPECDALRTEVTALSRRIARAHAHRAGTAAQRLDGVARRLVHPAARLAAQAERARRLAARLARAFAHARTVLDHRVRGVRSRLVRELRAPRPQAARVAHASHALVRAGRDRATRAARTVERLASALSLLNPSAVLDRGYAIVTAADGEIVTNAARLQVGQVVALTLARGGANASVTATQGATSDGDAR